MQYFERFEQSFLVVPCTSFTVCIFGMCLIPVVFSIGFDVSCFGRSLSIEAGEFSKNVVRNFTSDLRKAPNETGDRSNFEAAARARRKKKKKRTLRKMALNGILSHAYQGCHFFKNLS